MGALGICLPTTGMTADVTSRSLVGPLFVSLPWLGYGFSTR